MIILLRIFAFSLFLLAVTTADGQSCPAVTATAGPLSCTTGIVQLSATPGFTHYSWSPSTGLSNDTIANPIATVSAPITYTVTATGAGPNLIVNGDFALGNTGFSSAQTYNSLYNICNYYVNNMFFSSIALTDHTPTADNMSMSVDGCTTPITHVWESTPITVMPGTVYTFSFWNTRAVNPPVWQIHFIGDVSGDNVVGTTTVASALAGSAFVWDPYGVSSWNSGADNVVTIRLVNLQLSGYGNDFALDDFDFHRMCTVTDTVTFPPIGVVATAADSVICAGESTTLTATGGTQYIWGTGDTTAAITVSPLTTTAYPVTVLNGICSATASVTVNVLPMPVVSITGNDSFCQGEVSSLTAMGGINYIWSTGATGTGITISPAVTTSYWVIGQNTPTCADTFNFMVMVNTVPPPPVVYDTLVCPGAFLPPLTATGQNILWYTLPADTAGSIMAPVPVTDATGQYWYYATQTVGDCESDKAQLEVEVDSPPVFDMLHNIHLCTGEEATLGPNPVAGWQYHWSDSSNTTPRMVDETAVFTLTAVNICGTFTDSSTVVAEECICYFYLPNSFSPNADDVNDIFIPKYDCPVEAYTMRIYNRWGQAIFESNDIALGWDGRHKEQLAKSDVYTVMVQYTYILNGELVVKTHTGHVMLIR